MKKHFLVMLIAAFAVACSTKSSDGGSKDDDTKDEPGDERGRGTSTNPDDDDDDDNDITDNTDVAKPTTWDCTGDLSCLLLDENGDTDNVTVFFYGDGDTCKFDDPVDKVATLEVDGGKISSEGDLVGSYTFDSKTKTPKALHWDVGSGQRSLSNCKL